MTEIKTQSNGHVTNKKRSFEEYFEEPPYLASVLTYLVYVVLNIMGRFRDFVRKYQIEQNLSAIPSEKTTDFVPLYQDYESFYTRNCYIRIRDCWNRPVASVPGGELELIDRVSDDHNWSFRHLESTQKVYNFGSYNYLGFAQNKGLCADQVEETINQIGIGTGASRQNCGSMMIQKELERLVAEFMKQEAAIVFPMGFATNSLNIPTLADKHTCIISDEMNHTSLILGIRLSGAHIKRFKHNNIKSLEKQIRSAIIFGHPRTHRPFKKILVVVEGIYSMEGSILRLDEIVELKQTYNFHLYVDEAHSIGALGPNGQGVLDYYSNINSKDIDLAMGTFTKSFGSAGGYIAGSKRLIEYLREKSHASIYGMSMPGPVCQQIITSMKIIMGRMGGTDGEDRLRQLAWNTRYFRACLHKRGLIVFGNKDSPVVPIIICHPTKLAAFSRECLKRGVGTVVVGFPATSIILARARFCMSSSHTKAMIDKTLEVIDEVAYMVGIRYSKVKSPPAWCDEFLKNALSNPTSFHSDKPISNGIKMNGVDTTIKRSTLISSFENDQISDNIHRNNHYHR